MTRILLPVLLFWVAPAIADDLGTVRAALDARLVSMEAAVLAADHGAYMANIASGDAEFHAEQRHWADDLARHKPAEFDLSWGVGGEPSVADGQAAATLVMTWRLPEADQRRVEYPVRFLRHDGTWLYAGEAWTVVDGERVQALCAPGLESAGREVARAFPAIRAHDEEGFEITVDRVQRVKLYGAMEHLQASIYLSYVDGLGGWNEPGETIKLLTTQHVGEGGLDVLLAHEFGHVCTFEMGPHASAMPWWALEGAAELAAEAFSPGRERLDRYIHTLARSGRLGDWARLSDFRTVPISDYALVYPQGHHMLGYISDQWGRTPRNAWLRAMSQGKSLDEATREALGLGFDELDARWRKEVGAAEPEAAPVGE